MATQIISNLKLAPLTPALTMTEWLRLMHPEPFFPSEEANGRRRNKDNIGTLLTNLIPSLWRGRFPRCPHTGAALMFR
jgi:hypothetical protein